jgi:PKD domain
LFTTITPTGLIPPPAPVPAPAPSAASADARERDDRVAVDGDRVIDDGARTQDSLALLQSRCVDVDGGCGGRRDDDQQGAVGKLAGDQLDVHRAGGGVSVKASFTDSDNGPWSYKLDWGDGSATAGNTSNTGTISGISPHVYNRTGSFKAKLTVTDSKGAAGSSTISVRVR